MNALSELSRLPETKAQIQSFAYAAIDEILEGNVNPFEIEVRLKMFEETIKLIRKDPRIKNLLIEEVENGNNNVLGASLTLTTRKTADYSNDSKWNDLKAQIKGREALLKALKNPMADENTGELIEPPIYKHSEVITIKIK